MDIRFENNNKTELFCNIEVGECFVVDAHTPDEAVCIKAYSCGHGEIAVNLNSGVVLFPEDDDEVIPIRTELKVRLDG